MYPLLRHAVVRFEVSGTVRGVIPEKAHVVYRLDGGAPVEHECRVVKDKDGKEVKREKFSWTYQAEPRFICAKRP